MTFSGGRHSNTDAIAAVDVVFPMPISPVIIRFVPDFFNSLTVSIPAMIADSVSSLVIAEHSAIFLVPYITLRFASLSHSISVLMPTSIAVTPALKVFATALIFEHPSAISIAHSAVTSCPHCVTPSATTP